MLERDAWSARLSIGTRGPVLVPSETLTCSVALSHPINLCATCMEVERRSAGGRGVGGRVWKRKEEVDVHMAGMLIPAAAPL